MRTKPELIEFFQGYIGFLVPDIEKCIEATANFTVASNLMSYTENIGALINGHLGRRGFAGVDFDSFLSYLDFNGDDNYYIDLNLEFEETDENGNIITVGGGTNSDMYIALRCGLVHEYAPKTPCIIYNNADRVDNYELNTELRSRYNSQYPNNRPGVEIVTSSTVVGSYPTGAKFLLINNNAYFRDFKNAINKIEEKINLASIHDEILIKINTSCDRILSRRLV